MISFCTWIVDRLHQLEEVLPLNLERSAGHQCEFVLLDIGSTDGLAEFVRQVNDDRVRYIRQAWPIKTRHFSRLYNRAHAFARGDRLVTLDADNAIGPLYCDTVMRYVTMESFLWASDGDWSGGTIGRVAFHRDVFWGLGGYDESLGPVGYQDIDMIRRAKASGLRQKFCSRPAIVGHAVRNTKQETATGLGLTERDYRHINCVNGVRSRDNIAAGRLIANQPIVTISTD